MTIYQNKWAGCETYFVLIEKIGRMMYGIGLRNFNGNWLLDMNASYYTSSLEESPERWPIVGGISKADLIKAILSHIQREE